MGGVVGLTVGLGPLGNSFGLVVGAFLGVAAAPFACAGLYGNKLAIAIPAVFGATLVVTVPVVAGQNPALSTLLSFGTFCAGCMVGGTVLPSHPQYVAGRDCLTCGYSLEGNVSGRCPECGQPTGSDPSVHRRARGDLAWALAFGALVIALVGTAAILA